VVWLMVDPDFRRRGIGRALLATLEASAWQSGERELVLETHADWSAAVRLYESFGYARG
jgi:ribosomal protein S18 acetylase RimI-like enzyme